MAQSVVVLFPERAVRLGPAGEHWSLRRPRMLSVSVSVSVWCDTDDQ